MNAPLRLVIVDDEPLAIDRLRVMLERFEDVEVVGVANSGQAALELVKTVRPDGCLLDVGMPLMDGIDLARALGASARPPKVVFVTANPGQIGAGAGALGYVRKPFSERAILAAAALACDAPTNDYPVAMRDVSAG